MAGLLKKIIVPDKNGKMGDIVLGFDDLEGYLTNDFYFELLLADMGTVLRRANLRLIISSFLSP